MNTMMKQHEQLGLKSFNQLVQTCSNFRS
uniref:Uncharacterized protein n=1 Tax=Arundo donax TaxID=35708 RepID=A0A0A8Y7L6_ARUDO